MRSARLRLPISPLSLCWGLVMTLLVVYLGLIATVMSYATLTVEFSQSVRSMRATVATLEREYLSNMARITALDYTSEGYAQPIAKSFVRAENVSVLR